MSNFDDLFNLNAEDFKEEKEVRQVERYAPNAKDGEGNVYKALIRFLPWYKSPKQSEKDKRVCWLKNPETGEAKYVDCQGKLGKKDIITDLFFKLKKSESARDVELANEFKSTQKYAALIQVMNDKQHPELEGKIMVFQYGYTVHNKINEQIHPEYGKPCVPYNVFEGKPFKLNISLKSGFNNFDSCDFMSEYMPLVIDGKEMKKTPEDQQKIAEWLKTNSPDLDKYACQEWDKETEEFVRSAINAICPSERVYAKVETSANKGSEASTSAKVAPVKEEKKEMTFEDLNTETDSKEDEEYSDDDLYNLL